MNTKLDESYIKDLIKNGEQMTYGTPDGERVLDLEQRNCILVKPEHYKDLHYYCKGTLRTFEDMLREPLYAVYTGLLIYPKEGHFKSHVDDPKCKYLGKTYNKVGTRLITLNSDYEGGELITHGDIIQYHDKKRNWVDTLIPQDIEHEVKPVTKGYRLVMKYNIVKKQDIAKKLHVAGHNDSYIDSKIRLAKINYVRRKNGQRPLMD